MRRSLLRSPLCNILWPGNPSTQTYRPCKFRFYCCCSCWCLFCCFPHSIAQLAVWLALTPTYCKMLRTSAQGKWNAYAPLKRRKAAQICKKSFCMSSSDTKMREHVLVHVLLQHFDPLIWSCADSCANSCAAAAAYWTASCAAPYVDSSKHARRRATLSRPEKSFQGSVPLVGLLP